MIRSLAVHHHSSMTTRLPVIGTTNHSRADVRRCQMFLAQRVEILYGYSSSNITAVNNSTTDMICIFPTKKQVFAPSNLAAEYSMALRDNLTSPTPMLGKTLAAFLWKEDPHSLVQFRSTHLWPIVTWSPWRVRSIEVRLVHGCTCCSVSWSRAL